MRIGRILRNGKEEYGIFKDGLWYPQDSIRRNDLGIENFLLEDLEFDYSTAVNLADEDIEWLPPIARPGKILCVGRNYSEHSREQGLDPEKKPLIFSKFSSCMVGHLAEVQFPDHTQYLDYEVELALIIGKKASKLSDADDPLDYIFGYTVANDLTARDVQKSEKQWTRGKGFDQSLPIGPWIVKPEQHPLDNEIWLTVNGQKRQRSKTGNMIFSIQYLIKYLSQNITLEPGDIILTGTPEGVGYYMEPRATLHPGDQVACGVLDIGELRFSIK